MMTFVHVCYCFKMYFLFVVIVFVVVEGFFRWWWGDRGS